MYTGVSVRDVYGAAVGCVDTMVVRVLCSFTANSIGVGWQHRQAWAEHYERGSSHGYDGVGRGSHGCCGVPMFVSECAGLQQGKEQEYEQGQEQGVRGVLMWWSVRGMLHHAGVCCT